MDPSGDILKPSPEKADSNQQSVVTAYPSFAELFATLDHPYDNQAVSKIVEYASYTEPTSILSRAHARAQIARFAFISYSLGTDFDESLSPAAQSAIATYVHMMGIEGYTQEEALKDYLAGLHLEATQSLMGIDRFGVRLCKSLYDTQTRDLPHFFKEITNKAGSFAETSAVQTSLIQDIAERSKDDAYQKIVEGTVGDLLKAISPDSFNQIEAFELANTLANYAEQTVSPLFAIIDDYQALSNALPSSELLSILGKPENLRIMAMITYRPRHLTDARELTPKRIEDLKEEIDNIQKVLPLLHKFTESVSQAITSDSRKVGAMVDKKPGEEDSQYEIRINEILHNEKNTPEEDKITEFLSQEGLDLEHTPIPLLNEISKIIGIDLKHATFATPHTYAMANLLGELTAGLDELNKSQTSPDGGLTTWQVAGTEDQKVTKATSDEKVLQGRVLIQIERESDVAEYNYVTGEWKSSGVVEDGWPNVNVLSKAQYAVFERIMNRISHRNLVNI